MITKDSFCDFLIKKLGHKYGVQPDGVYQFKHPVTTYRPGFQRASAVQV